MPYIVSAWAADNGLVLGQLKVEEKSNEITAVPELLRTLKLAGCIVTADAMGCQKTIAREIRKAQAHYVLALKGKHKNAGWNHAYLLRLLGLSVALDGPAEAGEPS